MIGLELDSELFQSLPTRLFLNRLTANDLFDIVSDFPEQCVQVLIKILRRRWKFRMEFFQIFS